MRKIVLTLAVLAASTAAVPAMAQDGRADHFDGPYIAIVGDHSMQESDGDETLLFDTDRDGEYDDTVRTVLGADAFSPGFCGGTANGNNAAAGCSNDEDDFGAYARIGLDKRYGNFVVGALIEGGKSWATDSATGFSTTPASYTFTREVDYEAAARLRVGYTPNGGVLFYGTGGGAYAKLDNSFTTTNGANSFTDNGKSDAWGWQAGGGVEAMLGNNLSIGLEYLYTNFSDNDYVVEVGPGTAPATNPFLLNGGGTNMIRSDQDFDRHAVRVTTGLRF